MQDSGHDKAQHGNNPGITQNLTTWVTCYTDRVMTCFLQAKRQAQACEGRAGGESSLGAGAAPGGWTSVRWINRRAAAAGVTRRSRAFSASPVGAGTAVPSKTGLKKQKRA